MGGACSKSDDDIVGSAPEGPNAKHGTVGVMFDRFDKERTNYISLKNLKDMMKDDKTHFKGRDADHIMNKYGTDGKMNLEEFKQWWNSTYTTMVCTRNIRIARFWDWSRGNFALTLVLYFFVCLFGRTRWILPTWSTKYKVPIL